MDYFLYAVTDSRMVLTLTSAVSVGSSMQSLCNMMHKLNWMKVGEIYSKLQLLVGFHYLRVEINVGIEHIFFFGLL